MDTNILRRTSVALVVGVAVLSSMAINAARASEETRTTTTYSEGGYSPSVVESRTTTSSGSPTIIQERSTGYGDTTTVYPSASQTTTTIEHNAVVPDEPQVVTIKEKRKQKHLLHVGIPFSHVNVF